MWYDIFIIMAPTMELSREAVAQIIALEVNGSPREVGGWLGVARPT